jgi:hypothetical protein
VGYIGVDLQEADRANATGIGRRAWPLGGHVERELAPLHPVVVHFAIAFLVGGVLFRLAWLVGALLRTRRLAFAGPAASVLLLLGTLAAYVAVKSGESARGDVEGVPRAPCGSTRNGPRGPSASSPA